MNAIRHLRLVVLAGTFALLTNAPPALGQAPGTVDPLNANIVGSFILATVMQPDGKIIIAGQFAIVLGVARSNIARLNADGTLDAGFDPKTNGIVHSVAVQADGKILLAGAFTTLQPNGGSVGTRNRIARVNADGTLDTGFDPNPNQTVFCTAVQPDGKIILGGFFSTLQPNGGSVTTRNKIARVNADGTLDTGFDPSANNSIYSLAVQADSKVLLGGLFTTLQPNGAAAPTARSHIARVNADGSLDTGFDPNADSTVSCSAVQADGKILLGGDFTALQPNGAASGTPRSRLARLYPDGSLDTAFDPKPNGTIDTIAVQADGRILIGGLFGTVQPNGAAGTTARTSIARIHADGTVDTGFDPRANGEVFGLAVQADGKILAGGQFTALNPNGGGSIGRNLFARLNNYIVIQSLTASGGTQVLWQRDGAAPDVSQAAFELSADGGTSWTSLGSATRVGTTAIWQLGGLTLPAGGQLRARGRTTGGSRSSSGIVQQVEDFGPAGSLAASLNANVVGVAGIVFASAVQPDGKMIIAGQFTSVLGVARSNIARLNADGTLDTGFDPKANNLVACVAVQADGKILLGGQFTTLQPNGGSVTTRNRIARLNADGSLDTGFDPRADNAVYSVAVQADGKILLGGSFTTLQPNGAPSATARGGIARVNADGTLETGFDPNANSFVYSVAVQADGKILLGGQFTTLQPNGAVSATARGKFARLNNDAATQTLSAQGATQVFWLRGGAAPDVSQVIFYQSIDGGVNWTALGNGTRVASTSNWQMSGLSLPASGLLRALGRTTGGYFDGSSGMVQQFADFIPAAAGWNSAQLTAVPNAAEGNRTGATHFSASLYFYKGTDSNMWGLYWNGTQWAQAQLTSDGNVDDWLSYGTSYSLLAYKGKDNKLWVLYFNGTAWAAAPLGANANVAGDVVMDTAWNLIHYRGDDARVWVTWWTGTQWTQTSLGGTANVQASLAVDPVNHLVYYRSGGQIWCYYWTGSVWSQVQMSTMANVAGAVAADTGGGLAYYRASVDNSTWALYWNGSAWAQAQLDALAGMGPTESIAPLGQNVALYLNGNGRCHAEYWNGSRWVSGFLGGAGLAGGLSTQPNTNWVFARRSDGQVVIIYFQ